MVVLGDQKREGFLLFFGRRFVAHLFFAQRFAVQEEFYAFAI